MTVATTVYFTHPSPQVGSLTIETGLDQAQWGYNLNAVTYPTFGGEVVQILSVYIDDLTLGGTIATNSQCEAIYSYFAAYFQIATQGKNPNPAVGQSAYNLQPMTFSYPERGWNFSLIPMSAPGFAYDFDAVGRVWQMTAHIIDDSPDLASIKAAIADSVIESGLSGFQGINGQISPDSGNPETNPFQTYDQAAQQTQAAVQNVANYYNTLIPSYLSGDFSSLTGGLGSTPSSIYTSGAGGGTQVKVPNDG